MKNQQRNLKFVGNLSSLYGFRVAVEPTRWDSDGIVSYYDLHSLTWEIRHHGTRHDHEHLKAMLAAKIAGFLPELFAKHDSILIRKIKRRKLVLREIAIQLFDQPEPTYNLRVSYRFILTGQQS